MRIETTAQLREPPDGSIVASEPDCVWGIRYAGVRWEKTKAGMVSLDEDRLGRKPGSFVGAISSFKDPMPVRVMEVANEQRLD